MPEYRQVEFDDSLEQILREARAAGRSSINITAKQIHDRVWRKTSRTQRMPMACQALYKRAEGNPRVQLIHRPPSGFSTTLEFRFYL